MTENVNIRNNDVVVTQTIDLAKLSPDQLNLLKQQIDTALHTKALDKKTEKYKELAAELKVLQKELDVFNDGKYEIKFNVPVKIIVTNDGEQCVTEISSADDFYLEGQLELDKGGNFTKKQAASLSHHIDDNFSSVCSNFIDDFLPADIGTARDAFAKKVKAWRTKVEKANYEVEDFEE